MIFLALAAAAPTIGPVDIVRHEGHAYAFIDQLHDRAGADAACAMLSSAVVSVDSEAELWFLHDQLHDGRRLNSGGWSWVSTNLVAGGPYVLQFAHPREPRSALVAVGAGDAHRVICERAVR